MALTLALESSSSRSSSDHGREPQAAAGAGAGAGGGGGERGSSRPRPRERMFEKVVTPSDVGKLNRLVVPKHFAEKHLPLPGAAARAGGTVLCFHDARGGGGQQAAWRFRYSYWSSSQSYVMTKGWSRYVRDKRLAAGDTVAFCRDGARLFIDCRRRRRAVLAPPPPPQQQQQQCQYQQAFFVPNRTQVVVQAAQRHLGVVVVDSNKAVAAAVTMQQQQEEEEQEARRGRGRCLRLFGVNLELEPLLLDLQL